MSKAECRDLERQDNPESVFETSTQRAPTHLQTPNSKQTAFSERGIGRLFGAWRLFHCCWFSQKRTGCGWPDTSRGAGCGAQTG
jgi:hypothetical protein